MRFGQPQRITAAATLILRVRSTYSDCFGMNRNYEKGFSVLPEKRAEILVFSPKKCLTMVEGCGIITERDRDNYAHCDDAGDCSETR